MMNATESQDRSFRVWVASYSDWNPLLWSDVPPAAKAIEPAEPYCMTRSEAALYVEAFNRVMLEQSKRQRSGRLWAVSIKVTIRWDGDLSPGQQVGSDVIATQLFNTPEQPKECHRVAPTLDGNTAGHGAD